ncbi:hypothetical protein [Virgibacillus sp. Bac330]|uniref:hypothetical protein n=1 Tax=Virgibacillus sp. Bac330 TaxID=2419841 RepID=UPI000EF4EEEB|nr:hypothetical protein [Virgibacillus sp. Bac330]
MKKVAKKILISFMAITLILFLTPFLSQTAHAAKTGDTKKEVFYISAANLKNVGGSISAGSTIVKAFKKKYKKHPYVLAFGGTMFLAGSYGSLKGYKGYKLTLTYTYGKRRVFDGAVWVNYKGWGVPKIKISRYK